MASSMSQIPSDEQKGKKCNRPNGGDAVETKWGDIQNIEQIEPKYLMCGVTNESRMTS